MAVAILVLLLTLTYLPGLFLGLSTDAAAAAQVTSSTDVYSESPCELQAISAYKDNQGNVWGIGDGNLWWFNATNLSWSLLPLPNGTAASEPWRVACGDPRKYIAVVGKNATLVLHLPWQHWQFVDTDDVSLGYVDKDATWCVFGFLFGIDPLRETLYLLDPEEAHWTVRQDLPVMDNVNWSTPLGLVNTWIGLDSELILVEKFGDYKHVMYTNSSGISWVVMAEDTHAGKWPNLDQSEYGLSLTWNMGSEKMWLWKNEKGVAELWYFSYNTSEWHRGNRHFEKKLPHLLNVLTAWNEGDKYCVLQRSSECTAQYTLSHKNCWSEHEMIPVDGEFDNEDPTTQLTTIVTTDVSTQSEGINASQKSTSRVISPPSTTKETSPSSVNSRHEIISLISKHAAKTTRRSSERSNDAISITPARNSVWHQHTSVFGSVIFFGTSLTIFGLVGFFWCVRKCVHFPKEALLLRDPPSVRYTAIPDSLSYDSRKPTPATYTVIPDSIA
ncbi:uncharacterized protein LOC118203975 [Stegodyphus dumicola]|uniref:uncharacterized protein LOC118203975 n=1 Tax=Stegodyphus dumicola TaxID=202533 RepID=UPI0015B2E9B7|nr:uncharacterized protein LOC118203975 [Stegodyphus dumicola]